MKVYKNDSSNSFSKITTWTLIRGKQLLFPSAHPSLSSLFRPWSGEPIYRNGEFCGFVTSTAYGFTLGKQVGCIGSSRSGHVWLTFRCVWDMCTPRRDKRSPRTMSAALPMKSILLRNASKLVPICINHPRWVPQFSLAHLRDK
jgi:hypothetical protein